MDLTVTFPGGKKVEAEKKESKIYLTGLQLHI